VRRLVKIALVTLGIRWLLKRRKRRHEERQAAELPTTQAAPASGPADELKQKLAASRAEAEPDEAEQAAAPSVADRRAEVHEQGHATLDEMNSPDEG
jgi:hypothetical protein